MEGILDKHFKTRQVFVCCVSLLEGYRKYLSVHVFICFFAAYLRKIALDMKTHVTYVRQAQFISTSKSHSHKPEDLVSLPELQRFPIKIKGSTRTQTLRFKTTDSNLVRENQNVANFYSVSWCQATVAKLTTCFNHLAMIDWWGQE